MPYGLQPTGGPIRVGGSYPSAEMQSAYSAAPADRADYSPYLAPSNYCLFARPQKNALGKRFGSNENVISETEAYFEAKDKFYKKGITQEEFCLKVVVLLVRAGTYCVNWKAIISVICNYLFNIRFYFQIL